MSAGTTRSLSPYLALLLAVACVSLGSILVRWAQAPPLAVAFYRVALAAALLSPIALPAGVRTWPALGARQQLALAGSGIALALHFATWIASLSHTSIAASVLLVNTAPLFTLAFARAFLGESIRPALAAAAALALAGAGLIALADRGSGRDSLFGDALAVAGAVTLSLYHVAGRGLRNALPLPAYILGVWGIAALALGVMAVASATPLLGYSSRTLAAFLALALIPTLGGHGLMNRALRQLPAATVGLFLLGEPVGASLLAYAIFGERLGPLTLVGGVLVLAALALLALKGRS